MFISDPCINTRNLSLLKFAELFLYRILPATSVARVATAEIKEIQKDYKPDTIDKYILVQIGTVWYSLVQFGTICVVYGLKPFFSGYPAAPISVAHYKCGLNLANK